MYDSMPILQAMIEGFDDFEFLQFARRYRMRIHTHTDGPPGLFIARKERKIGSWTKVVVRSASGYGR